MFNEKEFLKKAGFYNWNSEEEIYIIDKSLEFYFQELGLDYITIATYFVELTYRNLDQSTDFIKNTAKEIAEALDYMRPHTSIALLSEEPIIRAFAEVLHRLN